jgi:hypothetical protein
LSKKQRSAKQYIQANTLKKSELFGNLNKSDKDLLARLISLNRQRKIFNS